MPKDPDPLSPTMSPDTRTSLFREMDYDSFYATRHHVQHFVGEVRLEHGFGFKPDPLKLTVRTHVVFALVGQIVVTRYDARYVYLTAEKPGDCVVEIAHPKVGVAASVGAGR